MGYNPFLPLAGARVNVLCIPAGSITPDRFQKFIKALQDAARIERKAVDSTPSSGYIFYDISANQDKWRAHLFPFETNSRCQVLLGIIDGERFVNASVAGTEESDVPQQENPGLIESIRARFEDQRPSEPGLAVRQLVCCGLTSGAPPGHDVLNMSEADGEDAARGVMITISRLLVESLTGIVTSLKGQPISMVPGSTAQAPSRTGTTPIPPSGSSTPVSTKPSSPMPTSNGVEQQVCVCHHAEAFIDLLIE